MTNYMIHKGKIVARYESDLKMAGHPDLQTYPWTGRRLLDQLESPLGEYVLKSQF